MPVSLEALQQQLDSLKEQLTESQRLATIGRAPENLSAILLTHEHSDHISGLPGLADKLQIPIYCNRGTQDGTIRADVGESMMLAVALWSFTHGIIQISMAKGEYLVKFGVTSPGLADYAFELIDRMARGRLSP